MRQFPVTEERKGKERALNTGQLPLGGLPMMNSVLGNLATLQDLYFDWPINSFKKMIKNDCVA